MSSPWLVQVRGNGLEQSGRFLHLFDMPLPAVAAFKEILNKSSDTVQACHAHGIVIVSSLVASQSRVLGDELGHSISEDASHLKGDYLAALAGVKPHSYCDELLRGVERKCELPR